MYIHHRNVRVLFQYLNVKSERKFQLQTTSDFKVKTKSTADKSY